MSTDLDLANAEWTKSSYSDASGGDCVEFTRALTEPHGLIPIRDSKNPDGPALIVRAAHWSAFVAAVKNGELRM
ncbi:DUF397 domain-containing protein [Streptomyces chattanoogensis]|uniref:DUF397 domain-containing protein n=1 Tax=Streptomyces chattanoogensis TaxID=66876 RepID=UPI003679C0FD